MRKNEFARLLAGSALALIVAAPIYAVAATPEQIETATQPPSAMPAAAPPRTGAARAAEALAAADITLSYSALTYARHLATGRIAPSRVLTEVDYGDHTPAPADILRQITEAAATRDA